MILLAVMPPLPLLEYPGLPTIATVFAVRVALPPRVIAELLVELAWTLHEGVVICGVPCRLIVPESAVSSASRQKLPGTPWTATARAEADGADAMKSRANHIGCGLVMMTSQALLSVV